MCGILGSVNLPFDLSTLDLIKHRGPDDFGLEQFAIANNDVLFAQRRLAIQDLSPAGHQPMLSTCGNFSLVFNGEVYNHLELREKLPSDIDFKGHSDTETILYYLIHFGIDAVADFNGIFALALLDKSHQKLYIARDPFGVKPLYYAASDNSLIFASEIRPVQAALANTSLNKASLASLLRLRFNAAPDTLYANIKKLKPGFYLGFDLGEQCQKTIEKYYIKPNNYQLAPSQAGLVEQYGKHFEQAVKRQLLADVEVGILLSGGIDSAVVAALAQKHCNGKLKAFTIGFEGEHAEDEINDAAHTAKLLGLEHYVKRISFSDFLGLIKTCSTIVEEPLATTSMIPMFYLSELASEHVSVVLTGQGADEPLGGYARYKIELYRRLAPSFLRPLIKPLVKLFNIKHEQLSRGANAIAINDEIKRFLLVYEIFTEDEIKHLINVKDNLSEQGIKSMADLLKVPSHKHSAEKMMAIDTRMNLADDLLNYTDKVTMNFSLECRVPMLDIELVNFIEALPIEAKVNRKGGKLIHKQFAHSLLPSEIINRPKKGFQSPTKRWFKEEMPRIKSILLAQDSRFAKVFNLSAVEHQLDQHMQGVNKEKQIFLLLSLYYWLDDNSNISL